MPNNKKKKDQTPVKGYSKLTWSRYSEDLLEYSYKMAL